MNYEYRELIQLKSNGKIIIIFYTLTLPKRTWHEILMKIVEFIQPLTFFFTKKPQPTIFEFNFIWRKLTSCSALITGKMSIHMQIILMKKNQTTYFIIMGWQLLKKLLNSIFFTHTIYVRYFIFRNSGKI